tara:strand:+ start:1109 stop:1348 length:240 start_codon:yes stop_codon:yes gene_type:complete
MAVDVLTQSSFALIIERMVKDLNIPYLDAVVLYCEQNNLEIESAARLLNSKKNKIRQSIESEASDLNLLKEKITPALPL